MKAWIARNLRHDTLELYLSKPIKNERVGFWLGVDSFEVPNEILPEGINPQWSDDEPIEVELKIEKV